VLFGADALFTGFAQISTQTSVVPSAVAQTLIGSISPALTPTTAKVGFGLGAGYAMAALGVGAYGFGLVSGVSVSDPATNSFD
jgi:hypothetical protein